MHTHTHIHTCCNWRSTCARFLSSPLSLSPPSFASLSSGRTTLPHKIFPPSLVVSASEALLCFFPPTIIKNKILYVSLMVRCMYVCFAHINTCMCVCSYHYWYVCVFYIYHYLYARALASLLVYTRVFTYVIYQLSVFRVALLHVLASFYMCSFCLLHVFVLRTTCVLVASYMCAAEKVQKNMQ